jgi:c-di-GMP-binding flagellar brake protein YcgR
MFERTRTFWRRLMGRAVNATNGTDQCGTDERRVWLRYPADLETSYQTDKVLGGTRLSARVRNISLAGINLLGNRAFQPGDLLTVELPGATDETTCNVLACVVHCEAQEQGEWSLGCTFSRELSNDDLASFGARRERHDPSDQRQWKRFPCDVSARCQLVASDGAEQWPCKVLDISATGVGLLVEREIDNGTLLSVELHNAAGTTELTMLACVVHLTRQSDTAWALGCNFIRSVSEEDLRALTLRDE